MPHQISIINLLYFISRPCKVHVLIHRDNKNITYNVLSLTNVIHFIIRQQPHRLGY
jgi:hypothetical protein